MCDEKPVLIYTAGRGLGETIRLTFAAAGIEFTHGPFVDSAERLAQLCDEHTLQFDQVPLVQYDGMDMVQSMATAKYFAHVKGMMGDCLRDTYRITMLSDGAHDFLMPFAMYGFVPDDQFNDRTDKACQRYMAKFEKILEGSRSGFLVGDKMSFADVELLNVWLNVEELKPHTFDPFPKCKAHKEKMKAVPTMKKYLESDQRFGLNTPEYVEMVKRTFGPRMINPIK